MQAIIDLLEKRIEVAFAKKKVYENSLSDYSVAVSYQNGKADAYIEIRDILTMLSELYEDVEVDVEIDDEGNYV